MTPCDSPSSVARLAKLGGGHKNLHQRASAVALLHKRVSVRSEAHARRAESSRQQISACPVTSAVQI